jgi:hypothetical protein
MLLGCQNLEKRFYKIIFKAHYILKVKQTWGVCPVKWLANSTHHQKVVGSNLVSSKILDGNGVKAMPFLHPILVHLKNKKIQAAKWDTPKNIFVK